MRSRSLLPLLPYYPLYVRSFSQTIFSNTHYSKLTFNDSQLFYFLSNHRFQEARNLLDKMPQRSNHARVVHLTSLLSKFSRDGFINEAKALFDIMPERNIVSYNAMLSGFVQCGRISEARRFFGEMPERNVVSWTSMLCGLLESGRVCEGKKFFYDMPEKNVVSWNSLIGGLIRNGDLEEARLVFDAMPVRNIISWNTMIAGYAENCRMKEARILFEEMEDRNVVTWTSMIAGYCRAGEVNEGYCLFCRMPERNIVSWTAMIGGFTWNGFYGEALLLFLEMKGNYEIRPNSETFVSLAYSCAGMGFPFLGKQLHAQVIVDGWEYDDYDGRLSRGLIHMYSVFGIMNFAFYIFKKNLNNSAVQSCNSMINGYIHIGQLEEAQYVFDISPIRDKISWTSMIDGYLSIGQVSKACYLFNNMPERDAVAWTAMISGYVQNELFVESISLFLGMRAQGVFPLNATYSILFGAAGATANLDQGRQFHCMLIKTQYEFDLILENSLISMYAKCGVIDDAYNIFSTMVSRDLVSWNSMIMGFSHHGLANEALKIFEAILESGIHPNSVTFLGILSACCHVGLISKALELFNSMRHIYGIQPGLEHYVSVINLLGRAGRIREAEEFVLRLPSEPDRAIWGALLGVCGFSETGVEIAKHAAQKLLELDPLNAPAHVVLCNIYAARGLYLAEQKLRKEMGLRGVRKVPGCSWIQLNGRVYMFKSGDKLHPQADEVLSLLFGVSDKS
ncbi:PREDICTED: pentatricopeptide repeat-containing protein At1g32415, mitochondrial [Theobroma cacao]|uniref:Pentatricopeptide repeat-containing protein At1g32415, mitochondrial n=1 Tax=Theobroma cacao TaxID=3641 RepID=A0AB32W4A4_THECC|nr:PREDICTED: pentatricopeptide repeat-containing protein At1g32415, mitochondrial [Theobroma cacao]XP_017973611.1 PREDICTED: pentatricopeptide repeat-containing protein At1g32415, mitochondrial [Theobroma cacao]XP_017973613.1 PREDICTED: pentatricopeptide repeat-containing protein At1g32415, mitochondrial [Theobroma cacao]XP_017973614.1 PREDICTED: pentatricopeptide repeat-containing protein At1g32415, mitochondrial [Theobroma cacao]XP_017973615.1 PREDICTED: pentatricopeptide repeat-containing p